MIMFGGSPHIVADPPRFAQKISARIIGTGLNFNSCESSTVTAARNRITVILSINIASTKDRSINVIKIGMIWYFTSFAIFMHNQRKNPDFAIPSTMIIIPAMNTIVSQLIPAEASLASPAVCQNPDEKILCMFSVSIIAEGLCIQRPNTRTSVRSAHPRVTMCLSQISVMIRMNIARKIITAKICAIISFLHDCRTMPSRVPLQWLPQSLFL